MPSPLLFLAEACTSPPFPSYQLNQKRYLDQLSCLFVAAIMEIISSADITAAISDMANRRTNKLEIKF